MGSSDDGAAYVFLSGTLGGLSEGDATDADARFEGPSGGSDFGASVSAGDADADGVSDVLVGAPDANLHGEAFLFLGPHSGSRVTSDATAILQGSGTTDDFGEQVRLDFDADGNGHSDVLIAAPRHNSSAGALYLWRSFEL